MVIVSNNTDCDVSFIEHKSAKDVAIAYFRDIHPRMKEENLLKIKTEFVPVEPTDTGKCLTIAELIIILEDYGVWGFCDHISDSYKEVNYWFNQNADEEKILKFLGHELGHAIGYHNEEIAIQFGKVTQFAYATYNKRFKDKIDD